MLQKSIALVFLAWCHFATSEWLPESYTEQTRMPPGYTAELGAYRDQNVYSKNQPAPEHDNFSLKTYLTPEGILDTNDVPSKHYGIANEAREIVKKRSILNSKLKHEEKKNYTVDTIGLARNKRWLINQNTNSVYARPNLQNTISDEFGDSHIISSPNDFPYYKRSFSPWGGKRAGENVREFKPKRIRFSSWGGKRSEPSMMKPWFKSNSAFLAHQSLDNSDMGNIPTHDGSYDKRTNHKFHSWGGKRNNINLPIYDAYSVQPLLSNRWSMANQLIDPNPLFVRDNWKKDAKKKLQFSAWGGKRSEFEERSEVTEETPISETNDNGNSDN